MDFGRGVYQTFGCKPIAFWRDTLRARSPKEAQTLEWQNSLVQLVRRNSGEKIRGSVELRIVGMQQSGLYAYLYERLNKPQEDI